jgi:hypothetical protein
MESYLIENRSRKRRMELALVEKRSKGEIRLQELVQTV